MRSFWLAAILSIAFHAVGFQNGAHHPHTQRADPLSGGSGWSALMAAMGDMHLAMASIDPSGTGDVDFVRLMLPHHQAAIDMARAQLTFGTDPQIRRLAQEIITDQQSEIALMEVWLARRDRSAGHGHTVVETQTLK